MSDADDKALRERRYRYLQLKAKAAAAEAPEEVAPAAQAAQPAPQQAAAPSWIEALFRGGGQGATVGLGDEAGGLAGAGFERLLPESMGGASAAERRLPFSSSYADARDLFRRQNDAAQAAHPWAYGLGNILGAAGTAPLGGAVFGGLARLGVPGMATLATALSGAKSAPLLSAPTLSSLVGAGMRPIAARTATLAGEMVGPTLLQKAAALGLGGMLTGGAYGLGTSRADLSPALSGSLPASGQMGAAANDLATSGLAGLGAGVVLPAVTSGLGMAARGLGRLASPLVNLARGGYVQPMPEAQRLVGQGARLTLGQMDPTSLFGRTEELAAKTATGAPLTALRGQGERDIQDVILKAAGAEGASPPTSGAPVAQQLKELKAGFSKLYDDALEREVLYPEKYEGKGHWRGLLTDWSSQGSGRTKGAFELASQDRGIDATPETRSRALNWLTDQANALMPRKSGPDAGKVDATSVQALRTRIRDNIRNLGNEGNDRQLKQIYERAEGFVTELLHGQLSPESSEKLLAADTAYGNLKTVEDAAHKAFVQDREFTPDQLLRAIRSRGSTPGLEAMARDAQAVLSPTYTPTGLQGAAVASLPAYKFIGPAWANLANRFPALTAHALRQPSPPGPLSRAATVAAQNLTDLAGAQRFSPTLYDLLRPRLGQGDANQSPAALGFSP